jgi:hypothetical protein
VILIKEIPTEQEIALYILLSISFILLTIHPLTGLIVGLVAAFLIILLYLVMAFRCYFLRKTGKRMLFLTESMNFMVAALAMAFFIARLLLPWKSHLPELLIPLLILMIVLNARIRIIFRSDDQQYWLKQSRMAILLWFWATGFLSDLSSSSIP